MIHTNSEKKSRPCGARARYNTEKCRCPACRKANSEYEKKRVRLNAYGRCDLVDAARVREHVISLMASRPGAADGLGRRTIAALAGVSESAVSSLVYGKRGRPLGRVRRRTEARLLSVKSDEPADGATVDARDTWRMIGEMTAVGIPKARIAKALGRKTPALQLSGKRVRARNARAVGRLHWQVWKRSGELRKVCRCPLPEYMRSWLEEPS